MAERKRSSPATSVLEWIAASAGALAAVVLLGLIGWEAATGSNGGPPEIVIERQQVTPTRGGFVVELTVRNLGDATAAELGVEGALMDAGGAELETSSATLDYLPGHARRRVGLLFTRDPRAHRLEARATGYREP